MGTILNRGGHLWNYRGRINNKEKQWKSNGKHGESKEGGTVILQRLPPPWPGALKRIPMPFSMPFEGLSKDF